MLSRGGQHIKRCGLSAGFSDHLAVGHVSVADEPLLFLYPRWFTSVSQQRRRSFHTSVSRKRIPDSSPGENPSHPRTTYSQHCQRSLAATSGQKWMSTSSTPMLSKIDIPTENTATPTRPLTNNTSILVGESGKFDAFAGLNAEYDESSDPLFERPQSVITRGRGSSQRYRPGVFKESVPSNHPRLRLPRHEARRMRSRNFWMRNYAPEEHISLYKQLKKMVLAAERRAQFGTSKATSLVQKHELHRKQILVPEETIAVLSGPSWTSTGSETISENIWFVRLHNGCKVHVLPAVESVGQNRKVILTGSEWVTTLVENRIKQTQELQENGDALIDIQKPPVPVFPSLRALNRDGLSAPVVRGVWNTNSISQPPAPWDLVTSNSKDISTVRGFVEHVDELTSSLPIPDNRGHMNKVATALYRLFFNTKTRHLVSTAALNKAISFLLEHGYRPYARALFVRGEHVLTIDTFNLFLKAAARDQNIPLFFQVMRILTRVQIPPNSDTLLAYLSCLNGPTARTKMVKLMEEKGYLQDPTVRRQVIHLTVQDFFTQHLKAGKSVDTFIDNTVTALGRSALSAPLINRMFHITVRLKKLSAMQQLLKLCKINGLPLTASTLRRVIQFFRDDTFSALDYALECLENPKSKLNKAAYEALFLNAFRNRHYNICRVLWRYACMDGMVTNAMKSKLALSLTQNTPKEGRRQQENLWQTSAGKVIVGIDLRSREFPLKQTLLKTIPIEFHDNPVAALMSNSMLQGNERVAQRRAASAILKHDMEVGSWYRPEIRLANMLEAAAELDRQWKDVPRTRNWLMQNAIEVRVKLVGHGYSRE